MIGDVVTLKENYMIKGGKVISMNILLVTILQTRGPKRRKEVVCDGRETEGICGKKRTLVKELVLKHCA